MMNFLVTIDEWLFRPALAALADALAKLLG